MTAKEMKKYALILQIGNTDPAAPSLRELFRELAGIDFSSAFDMWTYMMSTYVSRLSEINVSTNLEGGVFATFLAVSETKTKQLLSDNAVVLKLIYTCCATSTTNANLNYIVSLIVASKIEAADQILTLIGQNKTPGADFGTRMKNIIDCVFVASTKPGSRIPSLNRKQTMLLLEHTLKIKGPNKTLLSQRIKELQ